MVKPTTIVFESNLDIKNADIQFNIGFIKVSIYTYKNQLYRYQNCV